jgi:hypothetical protein
MEEASESYGSSDTTNIDKYGDLLDFLILRPIFSGFPRFVQTIAGIQRAGFPE